MAECSHCKGNGGKFECIALGWMAPHGGIHWHQEIPCPKCGKIADYPLAGGRPVADMTAEERAADLCGRYYDGSEGLEASRLICMVEGAIREAEQAAAAKARAEEREACAKLVENIKAGQRCPFDVPSGQPTPSPDELCPVCGQDSDGEGGQQCVGSAYRIEVAAAIRARTD